MVIPGLQTHDKYGSVFILNSRVLFILYYFFLHDIFRVCNVENVGHEHVLLRLYQVNPTFKSPANIDFLTLIADIDQL